MKLRFSAFLALAMLLAVSSLHAQTAAKRPPGSPAGCTCTTGEVTGVIGEGSVRIFRGSHASR